MSRFWQANLQMLLMAILMRELFGARFGPDGNELEALALAPGSTHHPWRPISTILVLHVPLGAIVVGHPIRECGSDIN